MFKKVQLKFFAITTSILLAIFIAVLASINLIMEAVMQRQSKVVLKQIASSIEYDDKTSTFTYMPDPFEDKSPPSDRSPAPDDNRQPDNIKPTAPTNSDTSATESEDSGTIPPEGATEPSVPEPSTEPANTPGSTPEEPTSPSAVQTTTEAVVQQESTRQTTTQTAVPPQNQPTNPAQTTQITQPQIPTMPGEPLPPEGNYPPPYEGEEPYPPYPWDDEHNNQSPNKPENDEYMYNEFPPTYENFDRYWEYTHGADDHYNYEENIQQENYISEAVNQPSVTLLSAGLTPPLHGYSIIDSAPLVKMAADNTAQKMEKTPVPKSLGSIDFFVLMADPSGNLLASLNNETITTDVAQKYITAILDDGASSGMLNSYQFCQMTKDNGTVMVFTDKSAEIDMLDQLTRTTILIGVVTFAVLSLLAYFLSKKSIEPIKVAFEKQKQFVSDASHELKTPLTIISANADVLSDEIGENKWLAYIKSQTERMNVLVNDLLNLTRLENNTADFICTDFNLSKAIENTALPFECQAFEMQKNFVIDIQEGLSVNGSERHIKQMAAIFIDNALKYSSPEGTVRVTLVSQGDKKILSVYNTGAGIKDSEKDKIFERFYRSDDSRARATGGYGLGLAIAKSIIDKHKFKVSVDNVEGESVCFIVTM